MEKTVLLVEDTLQAFSLYILGCKMSGDWMDLYRVFIHPCAYGMFLMTGKMSMLHGLEGGTKNRKYIL